MVSPILKTIQLPTLLAVLAQHALGQIQGRVVDLFGNPVPGALVAIQGFQFRATTSSDGSFSIDYVPGSFVLTASKQGFTPSSVKGTLNLSLAAKAKVPVDDLVLVKVPSANGLYLATMREYVRAEPAELRATEEIRGINAIVRWIVRGTPTLLPHQPSQQTTFLYPGYDPEGVLQEAKLVVLKVRPGGLLAEGVRVGAPVLSHITADIVHTVEVGSFAEGLLGGQISLTSDGLYALCRMSDQVGTGLPGLVLVPSSCHLLQRGNPSSTELAAHAAAGARPQGSDSASTSRPAARPQYPESGTTTLPNHPAPNAALLEQFNSDDSQNTIAPEGFHAGVDFVGPGAVIAAADGQVARVVSIRGKPREDDHGFGNTVILEHAAGDGRTLYTLYAHIGRLRDGLAVGSRLRRGDTIGTMGATGEGREQYWVRPATEGGRCYRPALAIRPTWCVRVHFEVKTRPVLENPQGGQVCKRLTLLGSRRSACFGYTPGPPDQYGYIDPWQVISGTLPLAVKPAASDLPPPSSDPVRKWAAYIAESMGQIELPAPTTGWHEIMAMTFGGVYDEYRQLYVRAVNRRSLAVDALVSANVFLQKNDLASVEKFAGLFARHFQESNDLLRDANRVLSGGVRNTADALNAIYRASSQASLYGWSMLCGVKCYEVADYAFLMLDFAVDNSLVSADEATKKLVAKAAVKVLMDAGLGAWISNRATQVIGQSGLYKFLEKQVRSPQVAKEIMKFVGASGAYSAQSITEEAVERVLRSAGEFIQRSVQQEMPQWREPETGGLDHIQVVLRTTAGALPRAARLEMVVNYGELTIAWDTSSKPVESLREAGLPTETFVLRPFAYEQYEAERRRLERLLAEIADRYRWERISA